MYLLPLGIKHYNILFYLYADKKKIKGDSTLASDGYSKSCIITTFDYFTVKVHQESCWGNAGE